MTREQMTREQMEELVLLLTPSPKKILKSFPTLSFAISLTASRRNRGDGNSSNDGNRDDCSVC
jgi:hypothetical protein